MLTLGQRVGLLEEAVVEILYAGMTYVRVVSTYNGELGDRAKLVEALKTLRRDFPLVLVGYTGGDVVAAARTPSADAPLDLSHPATLQVVCCADDSLAQYKRVRDAQPLTRKGEMALTHRMFSDVIDLLSNRQLKAEVSGEEITLNEGEFIPAGVDYVERIRGLTAVAVTFDLGFECSTPDRGEPPSGEITTVIFDLGVTRAPEQMNHPPGVFID